MRRVRFLTVWRALAICLIAEVLLIVFIQAYGESTNLWMTLGFPPLLWLLALLAEKFVPRVSDSDPHPGRRNDLTE